MKTYYMKWKKGTERKDVFEQCYEDGKSVQDADIPALYIEKRTGLPQFIKVTIEDGDKPNGKS